MICIEYDFEETYIKHENKDILMMSCLTSFNNTECPEFRADHHAMMSELQLMRMHNN